MSWKKLIRNPTQPLGSRSIPRQNFAQRPAPKMLGWRIEDKGNFVAAFSYGSRKAAQSEKKVIQAYTEDKLVPRFGPLKVALRSQTLIVVRSDVDPQRIEVADSGSPYFSTEMKQTRASDEPETRFVTDLLTGKQTKENPPAEIIITVPHAADDGIEDGHDTDWHSEPAARILADALLASGTDPIVMIGKDNRDEFDLNREWSNHRPFHIELDNHLENADLLLDIHSFPKEYPQWGEYDVILFAFGPYHTDEANEQVMELANHLREEAGVSVMIEQADDVRNFIQHKGMIAGAESHLVEVVEGKDPTPAMEALANYALGMKANIPTALPEGAAVQMFTIKFNLTKNGNKTKLLVPEILELDLEDMGFKKYRGDLMIEDRIYFRLPPGMPQEASLRFQRNATVAYLDKAHMLSSSELSVIYKLITEAMQEQPLLNPTANEQRNDKLKELGLDDDQVKEILPLFSSRKNTKEIKRLVGDAGGDMSGKILNEMFVMENIEGEESVEADEKSSITEKSSDEEVKQYLLDKNIEVPISNKGKFKRERALFLAAGIVTKQSDNQTIQEALEKKKLKIPKKEDGSLDRNKALNMLTQGKQKETATVTTMEFGPKRKSEKMKLSTKITRMVVSDLFPGSHRPEKEKAQGKGKGKGKGKQRQIDLKKIRKLKQFQKLSKAEKEDLLPRGTMSGEQFQRLREKFGNLDIYKNPPTHELQSVPVTPSGKVIATVEQIKSNPPKDSLKAIYGCETCGVKRMTHTEWHCVEHGHMKSNPPVKAVPSTGQFTMDVTGEFVKGASVVVTANGAASQLNVGTLEVPPLGSLDKSYGKIVRINMFRRKAGFTVVDALRQPEYIISVETGGKHYYAKNKVEIDGFARLKHFPDKKSEPRLRLETRGDLELYGEENTVVIRGKEHPLYEKIIINQPVVNPPEGWFGDRAFEPIRKGTAILHKPSRQKLIFGGYEIDDDGDTWYLLMDENGNLIGKIDDDEIEHYSIYPTSPVWKMNPPGEYKMNPSAYAKQYVKDHTLMTPKEEKKFERFKLKGPIGSAEFFEQVAKKVQVFGEGQGWVRDGYLYWKKGPGHLNYVEVDGHMLEGGTAWMHTHPAAWEPSQSSPDDFKVMHGLFINHGVRDFFTIIADRIDWFRVKKKDQIPLEEMVEVIEEFEEDIEKEFHIAEEAFQKRMGDKPYLTSEQTRYITEHFNKKIPEFQMSYRAYALSPQQMNGRSVPNPPPTVPVHGFFRGN